MAVAYLSMGSNLGDRLQYLLQGLRHLTADGAVRLDRVSTVYETGPQGVTDVPRYLNLAVRVQTELSPPELLARCLAAEQANGRVRLKRWDSRTLDMDLLLYDQVTMDQPDLQIPHPRMTERAFVLVPLLEIAPDLQLPGGRRLADYLPLVAGQEVEPHLPAAELLARLAAG